jgi:addiction module RelE/StbE family toxin
MRVRWTRLALADLISAREYLEAESPPAAETLVKKVAAAVQRLRKHPQSGRVVPERRSLGYRELVLPPSYRLVYAVAQGEIQVLRLWHARRDPEGM